MYAIETHQLQKSFGQQLAVDGLDLAIARGCVYGLLGPNGAGKTTTVRLLATLLKPSGGRASVLGLDLELDAAAIRGKVSLTGQFASVDEDLTGVENLMLIARLLGFSWQHARIRASELLEAFDLSDAAKRQVLTYSGGMRRRLDIATSLVLTPDILFLDEPTTGLDPRSRNQVWDIIRSIAAEGSTVLLTTQYLEEADRLADRMAVIDHGRLIAEGTSRELKASIGGGVLTLYLQNLDQSRAAIDLLKEHLQLEAKPSADPHQLCVPVSGDAQARHVIEVLHTQHIILTEFSLGSPSLDEVFFALTGKEQSA